MPAYPSGTVEQQVLQQYSYLFQMAQQLNLALEAAESSRTAAVQAAGKSRAAQGTEQEYQNLKSLIIKTADTVQADGSAFGAAGGRVCGFVRIRELR